MLPISYCFCHNECNALKPTNTSFSITLLYRHQVSHCLYPTCWSWSAKALQSQTILVQRCNPAGCWVGLPQGLFPQLYLAKCWKHSKMEMSTTQVGVPGLHHPPGGDIFSGSMPFPLQLDLCWAPARMPAKFTRTGAGANQEQVGSLYRLPTPSWRTELSELFAFFSSTCCVLSGRAQRAETSVLRVWPPS